jgi:hypothetical protein
VTTIIKKIGKIEKPEKRLELVDLAKKLNGKTVRKC